MQSTVRYDAPIDIKGTDADTDFTPYYVYFDEVVDCKYPVMNTVL